MKRKRETKSKNISLAIYFALFVIFIFALSFIFKTIDLVGNSRFDGKNRFTVAILNNNTADIISVSPKDKTLSRLLVSDVLGKDDLETLLIPVDSYIESGTYLPENVKSSFTKILLRPGSSSTDLTIIDLVRLAFYSSGVDGENIVEERVSSNERDKLASISSENFIDPRVFDDKVSIQITNSSTVSGLGRRLADYITNLGGNVILVNSSQDEEEKTAFFYNEKSYTVEKLSKMLGIPAEKKEDSWISDVIIIVGKDAPEVLSIR